jgi:hypothetical protein
MRRLIALVLGIVTGLSCFVVAGQVADAATAPRPAGWGEWLLPTGTYCVETQGSWILAKAAANWNASDANIVAKTVCTGYARNMTLKVRGVNVPTGGCAWAGSDAGWTRQTVRGVSILTPNAPMIYYNYALNRKAGCRATTAHVEHVYNHEFGHWLGLAHTSTRPSVLNGWTYKYPTKSDIDLINRGY